MQDHGLSIQYCSKGIDKDTEEERNRYAMASEAITK